MGRAFFNSTALLLGTALVAFPVEWMTSLPEAQKLAEVQQKLILVGFTGSDWCGPCTQLRRKVLDTPAFEKYAADSLILLEVDLPQRKDFDEKLKARNEALCKRFGVRGFPTVMVLTPEARVVGGFPPEVKSVDEARKAMELARESASLLDKALSARAEQRAALLAQVYRNLPEGKSFDAARIVLLEQIRKASPEDVTGLLAAGEVQKQAEQFDKERSVFAPNDRRLAPILERQLADAYPQNSPGILRAKVQYGMAVAESVEELEAVRSQLKALIPQLPPDEAAADQHLLDHFFNDLPSLLNTLRSSRQGN